MFSLLSSEIGNFGDIVYAVNPSIVSQVESQPIETVKFYDGFIPQLNGTINVYNQLNTVFQNVDITPLMNNIIKETTNIKTKGRKKTVGEVFGQEYVEKPKRGDFEDQEIDVVPTNYNIGRQTDEVVEEIATKLSPNNIGFIYDRIEEYGIRPSENKRKVLKDLAWDYYSSFDGTDFGYSDNFTVSGFLRYIDSVFSPDATAESAARFIEENKEKISEIAKRVEEPLLDAAWNGTKIIKEYEDEFVYIPSSGNCVYKLLMKINPEHADIVNKLQQKKMKKVKKRGIRIRNLRKIMKTDKIFSKLLFPRSYNFRLTEKGWILIGDSINKTSNLKMVLYQTTIYDNAHVILIKDACKMDDNALKLFLDNKVNSLIVDSTQLNVEDILLNVCRPSETKQNPIYTYDFEAYVIPDYIVCGTKEIPADEQLAYGVHVNQLDGKSPKTFIGDDTNEKLTEYVIDDLKKKCAEYRQQHETLFSTYEKNEAEIKQIKKHNRAVVREAKKVGLTVAETKSKLKQWRKIKTPKEFTHYKEMHKGILYAFNGGLYDTHFFRQSKKIMLRTGVIRNGSKIKKMKVYLESDPSFTIELRDIKDYLTGLHLSLALESLRCFNRKTEFDITRMTKAMYDKFEIIPTTTFLCEDLRGNKCQFIMKRGRVPLDTTLKPTNVSYKKIIEQKETSGTWVDYMVQDTNCNIELLNKLQGFMSSFGMDIRDHLTISSAAWKLLVKHSTIMGSEGWIPQDRTTVNFLRSAMYGGRVFAWRRRFNSGEYTEETEDILTCGDINSLYPAAMTNFPFPVGKPLLIRDEEHYHSLMKSRKMLIAEVQFTCPNTRYAKFPYKTEKGNLVYPCGSEYNGIRLQGVYTSVELIDGAEDGVHVDEFIRGIYWEKCSYIFRDLMKTLYDERNQLKKEFNSFESILKLIINSIYGKSGQKNNKKTYVNKNPKFKPSVDFVGRSVNGEKLMNGQFEYNINNIIDYKEDKCFYLTSFILSYARHIGNTYVRRIGEQNIYYSDTDSFYIRCRKVGDKLVTPDGIDINFSNELGGLKNDYKNEMENEDWCIGSAIFIDQKRYHLKLKDLNSAKTKSKAKFSGLKFTNAEGGQGCFANYAYVGSKERMIEEFYEDVYSTNENERTTKKIEQILWKRKNSRIFVGVNYKKFRMNVSHKGAFIGNIFYPVGYNHALPEHVFSNSRRDFTFVNYHTTISEFQTAVSIKNSHFTMSLPLRGDRWVSNDNKPGFPTSSIIFFGKKLYFKCRGSDKFCYELNKYGWCNKKIPLPAEFKYVFCMSGNSCYPTSTKLTVAECEKLSLCVSTFQLKPKVGELLAKSF